MQILNNSSSKNNNSLSNTESNLLISREYSRNNSMWQIQQLNIWEKSLSYRYELILNITIASFFLVKIRSVVCSFLFLFLLFRFVFAFFLQRRIENILLSIFNSIKFVVLLLKDNVQENLNRQKVFGLWRFEVCVWGVKGGFQRKF